MAINLKGNEKRIRSLAFEFIHGLTIDNTKEIPNGFDRGRDTCRRIEIAN